jgi:hypothetical protein
MMTLEERVAALEAKLAALTQPRKLAKVFNTERDAALREHWEAGKRATEILPILNAIPATLPVSSAQAVTSRASKLRFKRPPGWRAYVPVDAVSKVWTPERVAFLKANYGRLVPAELHRQINAMPGVKLENASSVRRAAARFGFKSARQLPPPTPPRRPDMMATPAPEPEPEPQPLTPEEQEAAVAAAWARKHARAMELFAQGKSAEAVSASIKVPLREACRLYGEYRSQAAQRKAA